MRVMCDIQYQPRSVADNLKTPGQNRILNTVADGLFAHRQPACAQCRQGGGGIRLWYLRQGQIFQRSLRIAIAPAVVLNLILPVHIPAQQVSALLFRHVGNGVRHIRLANHRGLIRAENTGLLTANTFAIGTQPVGMIQAMLVTTATSASTILVASRRPPRPTSRITTSSCACLNSHSADRVPYSK